MLSHFNRGISGLPEELRRDLIAARKAKGWTQRDFAGKVGMPQVHISAIETGKVTPRFDTLLDLVRVLEFDLVLAPRSLVPVVQSLIRDHRQRDDGGEGERPLYAADEERDES